MSGVLSHGYAVLWTDIDIVWLGNPLHLMPAVGNPKAVSGGRQAIIVKILLRTGVFVYEWNGMGWNGMKNSSCKLVKKSNPPAAEDGEGR